MRDFLEMLEGMLWYTPLRRVEVLTTIYINAATAALHFGFGMTWEYAITLVALGLTAFAMAEKEWKWATA